MPLSLRCHLQTLLLLTAALTLSACSRPPELHKIEGFAEGTTYHITWWAMHSVDEGVMSQRINAVLRDIDLAISNYRDDSLIEKFNRSSTTDWQSLPAPVIDLLVIAQRVHHGSKGCYDPTISPLFDLWGFRKDTLTLPSAEQISAVKQEVGFGHVALDIAQHRLRKSLPGLSIDMSSMGEGYTIWALHQVMEQYGVVNYIIEFGGDMLVKGHKPTGEKWRIAIARPEPGTMAPQDVITIEDEHGVSVNTSGTYRRYFDDNGKTYSHILDPRTGSPVTHNTVSATVIGNDPRIGDAWATAMLCMGKPEGEAVANSLGLKVMFIQNEGGKLVTSANAKLQQSTAVKSDTLSQEK